jgi:hypothetical protein
MNDVFRQRSKVTFVWSKPVPDGWTMLMGECIVKNVDRRTVRIVNPSARVYWMELTVCSAETGRYARLQTAGETHLENALRRADSWLRDPTGETR